MPRSTLETRQVLARAFSLDEVVEMSQKGLCMSVMVEIGRAKRPLREDLKALALQPGTSMQLIIRARQAGNRELRPATKSESMELSAEAKVDKARAAMHRAAAEVCERNAAQKQAQHERDSATCPRCAGEVDGAAGGANPIAKFTASLERDGATLYKRIGQIKALFAGKSARSARG